MLEYNRGGHASLWVGSIILIPCISRLFRRRLGRDLLPFPSLLVLHVVMKWCYCLWACSWVYLEKGPSLMKILLVWWLGLRANLVLAPDWKSWGCSIHHMPWASMSLFLPNFYTGHIGPNPRSRRNIAYIRCVCIFQGVE